MSKTPGDAPRGVRTASSWLISSVLLVAACKSGFPDGAICLENSDCGSEQCSLNLCYGSECKCDGYCGAKGLPSDDCLPGWLCVSYSSSSFTDAIFGGGKSGAKCLATCPNCPEHYECNTSSGFCSPQQGWQNPTVKITSTPDPPEVGRIVTFRAEGASALGDTDFVFKWSFYNDPHNILEGPEVTKTYDYFMNDRVDVTVESGGGKRTGKASKSVSLCIPQGATCSLSGPNFCCGTLRCKPEGTCQ